MENDALAGLNVMVVEDEMLVSLLIEDILENQSCVVVGPFGRVLGAMAAAQTEPIDIAVLDVNVAGSQTYGVAEVLAARGIPFLFLSGYGRHAIPDDHPEWRVCSKPFHQQQLLTMMAEQIERGRRLKSAMS